MSAKRPQTQSGKARAAFLRGKITRAEYRSILRGDLFIYGTHLCAWEEDGRWFYHRMRVRKI
jgi:hypothetical protein